MAKFQWNLLVGMTLLATTVLGAMKASAAVKSEEPFDEWVVRTLEFPNAEVVVALATAKRDALNGAVVSCKAGQAPDMSVIGPHGRSQSLSIKELAGGITSIKVTVDGKTIASNWHGMLIPAGFHISLDSADGFISQMRGKSIQFKVNDMKASFPLKGFQEGLARFREACGMLQAKP